MRVLISILIFSSGDLKRPKYGKKAQCVQQRARVHTRRAVAKTQMATAVTSQHQDELISSYATVEADPTTARTVIAIATEARGA